MRVAVSAIALVAVQHRVQAVLVHDAWQAVRVLQRAVELLQIEGERDAVARAAQDLRAVGLLDVWRVRGRRRHRTAIAASRLIEKRICRRQ